MSEENQEKMIVVPEPAGIVRVAGDAAEAFEEYKKLQDRLDLVMKDSTMQIRGKLFRKKSYWRAIATAFNLNIDLVGEQQIASPDDTKDWGWIVTYVARASNGRYAVGDGACFASEKPGPGQGTVHNVRGHAHTRGYNRAVSNLVGFGEVSAEEINNSSPREQPGGQKSDTRTEQQRVKIMAMANNYCKKTGAADIKEVLQDIYKKLKMDVHSSAKLTKSQASQIIDYLEEELT